MSIHLSTLTTRNLQYLPVTIVLRMDKFRIAVLTVSVIMFFIQFKIALEKLISPPKLDSTSNRELAEKDLPIITICPKNQTNKKGLKDLGYADENYLLSGDTGNSISWGSYHNLTFVQVLDKAFFKTIVRNLHFIVDDKEQLDTSIIYLPAFGFCKELSNYSTRSVMQIFRGNSPIPILTDLRLFITDRNYRSYFSLDFTSQNGNPIIIPKDEIHFYDVDVKVISTCNVDDKNADADKDKFKQCVDEEIQKLIGQPLGCIPPWMSTYNQCNDTYPLYFANKINGFWKKFIFPPLTLQNMDIEKKCWKFCSLTRSTIILREKKVSQEGSIFITFNQQLLVNEKVFNYSLFKFIIDVGSSIGLWLGLSALGIYDIIVQAVNNKIVKSLYSKSLPC